MSDPVPAITEAEATGETAAIYTDIRRVYGVGVVNLVWRHLATLPGALPGPVGFRAQCSLVSDPALKARSVIERFLA